MNLHHPVRPAPSAALGTPLLDVHELSVRYGGIEAVRGISLHLNRGEIVAIVGANGAGKTTTLKAIVRLLTPTAGTVTFDGESLLPLATEDIVARGISLVPEGRGVFPTLSVRENLELGAWNHRHGPTMQATLADVVSLFPRLGERLRQEAGTLSGGEQQMVAMGRALMARPTVLLLDEPSLGIAPVLAQQIFAAIAHIASCGVSVLLVEQNTHLALTVSARAYVIKSGQNYLEGLSAELMKNPEVQHAYLGS